MDISIFGLGYVGSVTAASLAEMGHIIIGIDKDVVKVENIQNGESPVREPRLGELIRNNLSIGRLSVTDNIQLAIDKSSCSIIAVGTPSNPNGKVNLGAIESCIRSISHALKTNKKKSSHLIVLRSTVPPGTTEKMLTLASDISGLILGDQLFGGMNPEFLREGSAIEDFFNPSVIVLGANDLKSHRKMKNIYNSIDAEVVTVSTRTAEIVKYTNNTFHALKIAFANEISRISSMDNIDSHEVMKILCLDKKLNISSSYLKPGFAFGGSCLPKDLRALSQFAKQKNVEVPLINSIIPSNDKHILVALNIILNLKKKNIGILGFAFKTGTDDLRESPSVRLVAELVKQGKDVKVYDPIVKLNEIRGVNRIFVDNELPLWKDLLVDDIDDLKKVSDIFVLAHNDQHYLHLLKDVNPEQIVNLSLGKYSL